MPELVKMVKNPDVTVRMRGVMEKVHLLRPAHANGKIAQEARRPAPGDVRSSPTAPSRPPANRCARLRPSSSAISTTRPAPSRRLKAQDRDYAVLGYLNIRPRTTYLGKLRNPNPQMPDYSALPLSRVEYNQQEPSGP
jgi:hypothetical protein